MPSSRSGGCKAISTSRSRRPGGPGSRAARLYRGRDGRHVIVVEPQAGGGNPAVYLRRIARADNGAGYARPGERPRDGGGRDRDTVPFCNRTQRVDETEVAGQLDTRIYPFGLSGWLDLDLDTALLAV